MNIYIVRHGQSQDNAHKIVSGISETTLTQLGREQARLAGKQANELKIDFIACSPLGRAKETAALIADALDYPESKIKIMPELKERALGDLEGRSYASNELLNGNFPATELIAGVEPLTLVHSRVQQALRKIHSLKGHKNVLIVCHMNIGRMLQVIAGGGDPNQLYDQPRLENGQILPLLNS